jgi:hypothetical protein
MASNNKIKAMWNLKITTVKLKKMYYLKFNKALLLSPDPHTYILMKLEGSAIRWIKVRHNFVI